MDPAGSGAVDRSQLAIVPTGGSPGAEADSNHPYISTAPRRVSRRYSKKAIEDTKRKSIGTSSEFEWIKMDLPQMESSMVSDGYGSRGKSSVRRSDAEIAQVVRHGDLSVEDVFGSDSDSEDEQDSGYDVPPAEPRSASGGAGAMDDEAASEAIAALDAVLDGTLEDSKGSTELQESRHVDAAQLPNGPRDRPPAGKTTSAGAAAGRQGKATEKRTADDRQPQGGGARAEEDDNLLTQHAPDLLDSLPSSLKRDSRRQAAADAMAQGDHDINGSASSVGSPQRNTGESSHSSHGSPTRLDITGATSPGAREEAVAMRWKRYADECQERWEAAEAEAAAARTRAEAADARAMAAEESARAMRASMNRTSAMQGALAAAVRAAAARVAAAEEAARIAGQQRGVSAAGVVKAADRARDEDWEHLVGTSVTSAQGEVVGEKLAAEAGRYRARAEASAETARLAHLDNARLREQLDRIKTQNDGLEKYRESAEQRARYTSGRLQERDATIVRLQKDVMELRQYATINSGRLSGSSSRTVNRQSPRAYASSVSASLCVAAVVAKAPASSSTEPPDSRHTTTAVAAEDATVPEAVAMEAVATARAEAEAAAQTLVDHWRRAHERASMQREDAMAACIRGQRACRRLVRAARAHLDAIQEAASRRRNAGTDARRSVDSGSALGSALGSNGADVDRGASAGMGSSAWLGRALARGMSPPPHAKALESAWQKAAKWAGQLGSSQASSVAVPSSSRPRDGRNDGSRSSPIDGSGEQKIVPPGVRSQLGVAAAEARSLPFMHSSMPDGPALGQQLQLGVQAGASFGDRLGAGRSGRRIGSPSDRRIRESHATGSGSKIRGWRGSPSTAAGTATGLESTIPPVLRSPAPASPVPRVVAGRSSPRGRAGDAASALPVTGVKDSRVAPGSTNGREGTNGRQMLPSATIQHMVGSSKPRRHAYARRSTESGAGTGVEVVVQVDVDGAPGGTLVVSAGRESKQISSKRKGPSRAGSGKGGRARPASNWNLYHERRQAISRPVFHGTRGQAAKKTATRTRCAKLGLGRKSKAATSLEDFSKVWLPSGASVGYLLRAY